MDGSLAEWLTLAVLAVSAWYHRRSTVQALVEERTAELRRLALHDPLTGLPNRMMLLEHGESAHDRARRGDEDIAVLYLDLDGFKAINDDLGHAAGDDLLRQVAGRLLDVVPDGGLAARLGGDEFVVVLRGQHCDDLANTVADRVLEVMRRPFRLSAGGEAYSLTTSLGIATGARSTFSELLADADRALYRAKALGRDRACHHGSPTRTPCATTGLRIIRGDRGRRSPPALPVRRLQRS